MEETMIIAGNIAVGWGALNAGCEAFYGYPITPQNDIPEWFSEEFPKRGKVFIQTESETGSINMLMGGAAIGKRVITSTSGPGWWLMQETMSHLATAQLPCVIVLVQRGGPGQGSIRHAQMDYDLVVKGGGGGHRKIVLAPNSAQENHDLVQLAFYLADKYLNPVIVMSDALTGQVAEKVRVKPLDFGPLPEKDWAVLGRGYHADGKRRWIHSLPTLPVPGVPDYRTWLVNMRKKYQEITNAEVRYENYRADDAELVLVAFGYPSRVCKEAVNMAREQGLKVGLIRPITLWPFPEQILREKAEAGCRFLVVEDNLGMMVNDVKLATDCKKPVDLLDFTFRHTPTDAGMILPSIVLKEVKKLL